MLILTTSVMFAYAFMLGAAVYSAVAGVALRSKSCAQSAAVCFVAAVHYKGIRDLVTDETKHFLDSRRQGKPEFDTLSAHELQTFLQYSDWVCTMPLLAMKLLAMAREGPGKLGGVASWEYLPVTVGLVALLMILSGAASVIKTGAWGIRLQNTRDVVVRVCALLTGCGCLATLYSLIFVTAEQAQSRHGANIYLASLVWIFYPVIVVYEMVFGCVPREWRTLCIGILDVLSKAFLAVYVVHDAFSTYA